MTNSSTSGKDTGQTTRGTGGSATPRRKTAAGLPRKPRIPGGADVAGAATSQAKGAVGAVRRSSTGAAERGRSTGVQAADAAGRAVTGAAKREPAARGQAVSGVRRASSGAAERGRAGGQVGRAAGAVAKTGRSAAGEVTRGAAGVAGTGRGAVGQAVSTTTDAGKAVTGAAVGAAVGSAVRIGARMAFSFLIGKALLLLELIKRLCLAAVGALAQLAGRLQERLASASGRSGDSADQGIER
jgi:hypothetical protein